MNGSTTMPGGIASTWAASTRTASIIARMLAVIGCLWLSVACAQSDTATTQQAFTIGELMWSGRSNGEDVVWAEANRYCATLELDGHSDWRLPTLFELETLHDPDNEANGYIVSPLTLDGCCLWSDTSLADLAAEEAGLPGGQSNPPSQYYWGLLFAGPVRYYSVVIFPDGQAMCVRDR